MRLSELQHKDIVDLSGKKIGNIIDVVLDNKGIVKSLVIEANKSLFKFNNKDSVAEISWDMIERIGEDVILIKG